MSGIIVSMSQMKRGFLGEDMETIDPLGTICPSSCSHIQPQFRQYIKADANRYYGHIRNPRFM